jgi:hypothetical protein
MLTDAITRRKIVRRATAVVLAAAIAAAGVVTALAASGDDSSSGGNAVGLRVAGTALIGNNKGTGAIFTASNLKPGGQTSGTVTITNQGDPSVFSVTKSTPTGTTGFADQLQLQVLENSTQIYSGSLSGFASSAVGLGTWSSGESRTYTFNVTMPSGISNTFQGATTSVNLTWNSTANDLPDTGTGGGGTTTSGGGTTTSGGGGTTTSGTGGVAGAPAILKLGGLLTQHNPALVTFFATCNQKCGLVITGTVSVPGASKVFRLTKSTRTLLAGRKTKVTYRFSTKVRNAIRKAIRRHKTATVSLRLTTITTANVSKTSTRLIRIKK